MATGDIVGVTIDPDGWTASIEIEGLATGGTYDFGAGIEQSPDNAKIAFTVKSNGYNAACTAADHTRIVYGTKQLRKVYPDNALNDETVNGSNVIIKIALSAAVFQPDHDITVNIGAGVYTQGSASSSVSNLSVSNNSTATYPKVVGNWSYPGQSVVTENFTVRTCFAHYSAENGQMIRGVRYTATDEHSHSYSILVTNATIDAEMTARGGNPVIEYIGTIDVSGFTIGDKITVNFEALPIWGDSLYSGDGVNIAPSPLYCSIYFRYLSNSSRYCAVVDSSMPDNTSGQVILASTFNPASPPIAFKNIFAAVNSLRTSIGSADISGSIIYLRQGDHILYGGNMTAGTYSEFWLDITSFPNEMGSIVSTSTGALPVNSSVKFSKIRIALSTNYLGTSENFIWIDQCIDNRTGGYLIYSSAPMITYITHCQINYNLDLPFSTTNNPCAIFRGNLFSSGGGRIVPFILIGNKSTGNLFPYIQQYYAGMTIVPPENIFIGFNNLTKNTNFSHFFGSTPCTHGFALVQNIFEKVVEIEPCMQIAADSSTVSPVNNVLLWHNTYVGERINMAYNDYNLNSVNPPAYRRYWSIKNNIFHRVSTVADVDPHGGTAGAPRNGGWYVRYGVQRSGNLFTSQVYYNEFWGFKSLNPNFGHSSNNIDVQNYIKFVADRSFVGDGSGRGDYHLLEGSPAIGNAYDFIVPYDLDGNQRYSGGAAGVYEYGSAGPSITTHPQSQSKIEGQTVEFSVSATTEDGPLSYQWFKNSSPISGATSSTYSFVTTLADDGAQIYCAVTDVNGTTNSNVATLTIEERVLTSIVVSPPATRVKVELQRQFTAVALDQTGTALNTQPEFTWSTDSEYGSINTQGLFTAGATAEECTVTATVGAVFDDASVSVLEKLPKAQSKPTLNTGILIST